MVGILEIKQLWSTSLLDTYQQLASIQLFKNLFLLDEINALGFITAVLIIIFSLGTVFSKKWMSKLLSLSVTGLLVSFYFVLYKAPDLALTQMMVEVVSLVFVLLLLSKLNKADEEKENTVKSSTLWQVIKVAISAFSGSVLFLILGVLTDQSASDSTFNSIGRYFIDKTESLAEGTNAVNTILVDFRGFDTMGEISVLTIAVLSIIGLLYSQYQKGASK